tara:strand:+ start:111 stop:398 length:288 start_codon:yes stop_codon:yes gene_type:complete
MEHAELNIQAALVELDGKLDRVMDSIETVKQRQEEIATDVSEIKRAIYDPDLGLYARIRELEQWKKTSVRIMWLLIAGGCSLFFAVLKNTFGLIP